VGWPADDLPLEAKLGFSVERNGVKLSAWDFNSQPQISLRLYLAEHASGNHLEEVTLLPLDGTAWTNWLAAMRVAFTAQLTDEIAGSRQPPQNPAAFADLKRQLEVGKILAFVAPRGVGLTAWSGDEKAKTKIRRRFMALGQTLDGMRVWDIRRAVQMIHFVRDADVAKVELQAAGQMGVNALYASLFEASVRKLELGDLPKSQIEGPDYLGVLRVTDVPEVVEALGSKVGVR